MKAIIKYTLLAWLIYAVFWVLLFASYIGWTPAFIRVSNVIAVEIVLFYLNLLYLIPRFLDAQRKGTYFLILLITMLVCVIGGGFLDIYLESIYPLKFEGIHHQPFYSFFFARTAMSVMPLVVSALVHRSIQVRKQREEGLELRNKMLEAETKALKAQINPHFLFNSLNNIYALSQIKSDKTPNAILHLSDILRYVTYESNQNFVDLKDEIKTIESFIMLQALKDDNQSNIRIEIDSANGHYKIAPLLLIPFIENSFKHSNHEDKEKGWIEIKLHAADGKIKLQCSNSVGHTNLQRDKTKDKTGGVGLENVRKRLALIYPDKHSLSSTQNESSYKVELEITLDK